MATRSISAEESQLAASLLQRARAAMTAITDYDQRTVSDISDAAFTIN